MARLSSHLTALLAFLITFLSAAAQNATANNSTTPHNTTTASNSTSTPITAAQLAQLEHFWSYGRSPSVYPSPPGHGTGDWAASYAAAVTMVVNMTTEEKENITYGYSSSTTGCSGVSGGVPRLGFPGLCLNDAGNGVRGTDGVNAYASGVHVGASWNRSLTYARGLYMGMEFKAKGAHVALGPVVGPLGRVAEGGRNWEGFAADPYLAGVLAAETVMGMQQSVITSVKHFIANEQETNRVPVGNNASVSSNLNDTTMHELYLWPFQDAVRAGAGCIMCSYNKINNSYACQNSKILNGLLKTELGFQGFVVSDWGAQHAGYSSAYAGLDMAMPDSTYWKRNLIQGINNGSFEESRLDDMSTRIIATWHKLAYFNNTGAGIPVNLTAPHNLTDARNVSSKSTIFQGAVEGHVLVKNVGNALPLRAPKVLSLFGYDAHVAPQNNPPASGFGRWTFGSESLNVTDIGAVTLFLSTNNTGQAESAPLGTIITGGGSGANSPAYISAPYDAFVQRAYTDDTLIFHDFTSQNPDVAGASSACIVFINEWASEGYDRPGLANATSDRLVVNVASKCNNTMVVIHNAGIRVVDAWIENPNVTAVLYAHLPGQDSGRSLVEIMYGVQSPSGKLPYTVPRNATDLGALLAPTMPSGTSGYYTQSNFTEGTGIDYRHYLATNTTPRFPFGHGLTYTIFSYSFLNLALNQSAFVTTNTTSNSTRTSNSTSIVTTNTTITRAIPLLPPTASTLSGGNPRLFDTVLTANITISNVGASNASEIVQLYLTRPLGNTSYTASTTAANHTAIDSVRVLRGFEKVAVPVNGSVVVPFNLTRRDLSRWDAGVQQWVLGKGVYTVAVGASVMDIRVSANITVA